MKQITLTVLLLCGFGLSTLLGQSANIRGNVYDQATGDPIIYGTVVLEGTEIGTNTDVDGFFSIGNVEPGKYKVVITYIGYDSVALDVTVKEGAIIYKQFYMVESAVELGTVSVSARKTTAKTEVQVSQVTLTPKQIRSLPATGGEADIAQYLPVLPGIISTGDQGGQLYIRGGAPIQNLILLDGMTIYNPFHSIGFFSVFETETIRSVDVYTGGFNANYGGRISAVVDIKTREGNKKRYGGRISASPFMAKALVEGPIKKLKDDGGGSSSFLLTGKHSYIDQTSRALYSYAESAIDSTNSLPYNFTDLYGKLSFLTGNGSKLNIFGFNFRDQINFSVADLSWLSTGVGADFTVIPPSSNFIFGGTVAFSDYDIQLIEQDGNPRQSSISNVSAQLDFTYFGGSNELNYGFIFNGISTDFTFRNFLGNTIEQLNFTTELAGFAVLKQKLGNVILEPSLRMQFYPSQQATSIEPRFGMKWNITDFLRFKAAGGLYSQNLLSSTNENDVVSLFVGFLTGPEESIQLPGSNEIASNRLQTAAHAIAGFEVDLTTQLEFNVEGYFKDFTQLIFVNRNKLSASDPDYAAETGDAYGIDFSLRYENQDLYLWGTYSLGYVNRNDGEQEFPTVFDRRHNVNLLGTYTFGEKDAWELGVRWNYGSPFPFTQTQGFFSLINFIEQGLGTDPLTSNPPLGIIFADERNGGRLVPYHRLDTSLKRTIFFGEHTSLEILASVTNVYNRNNIFFIDRKTADRVDQLPILPSLGLTLNL